MKSHEAIQLCVGRDSVEIAGAISKSPDLVRKWKEDPIDGSGAPNPLDLMRKMMAASLALGRPHEEALAPVRYLEECFLFAQPVVPLHDAHADLIQEISHLIGEHAAAIRDKRVSAAERGRIRREVEHVRARLDEYAASVEETGDL